MRLIRSTAVFALALACRPSPAVQTSAVPPSARMAESRAGILSTKRLLRPVAHDHRSGMPGFESARSPRCYRRSAEVVSVFGDTTRERPCGCGGIASRWDIDVRSYETHDRVAHYVGVFSGSSRARFEERLARGVRYDSMIRTKLRVSGLPEDLTYLALIESGYDPHAYSRAAAVGMWQFMSSTARDVGMRVDWWVDERRDPARATDGAITFLRDLQKQFGGSLYLAAAAYNGGPGRVSRGLTRFADERTARREDRFFALASRHLRSETKNMCRAERRALVAKAGTHGSA